MSEAADPYYAGRAENYLAHHRKSLRNRLTSEREMAILQLALEAAGSPSTVLDAPCGTGRFWPVFERAGVQKLLAGDYSLSMLRVAQREETSIPSFELAELDLLNLDLPDNHVEFIACMRFCHHLACADDRMRVLHRLHAVSRSHVAISLWVDGNLQSLNRHRKRARPAAPGFGRRICRPVSEVEAEFTRAGFEVSRHWDLWPRLSMWRTYLLEKR
jgi:SAM-dependent methyltransferase